MSTILNVLEVNRIIHSATVGGPPIGCPNGRGEKRQEQNFALVIFPCSWQ